MMDVLTLVHGREAHLANLIAGLERSRLLPDRLIIVHMNQSAYAWTSERFPIQNREIHTVDGRLPLARARNLAAQTARSDKLVFLDVDCIPSQGLIESYSELLERNEDTIYQGVVHYLAPRQMTEWSEDLLDASSSRHDAFNSFKPGDRLAHHMFWSLNFACHRRTFERIGGFDERYTGYGGEDTDFAFRAKRSDIDLKFVDARAFHQHHATYSPPLNHFVDLVRNATLFHDLWGWWPMTDWLNAFAASGYIELNDLSIKILRMPTSFEIAACRST